MNVATWNRCKRCHCEQGHGVMVEGGQGLLPQRNPGYGHSVRCLCESGYIERLCKDVAANEAQRGEEKQG